MINYFKKTLPLLLTALFIVSCGGDDDDYNVSPGSQSPSGSKTVNVNANPTTQHKEYGRLEVPRIKGTSDNLVLIHYTSQYGLNYMVEWDCIKKSQRWTCYTLDTRNSVKNVSRYYGDPQYPNDPDLPSMFRFTEDPYWGSGFDHGHICPSYDRLCSAEANYQTFFLSNMQPQFNKFNAGLWAKMRGAAQVTVIGRSEQKRSMIEKFGLEYKVQDGRMENEYDFVLEAVGTPASVEAAINATRRGGRLVLMGNPSGDITLSQSVYWKILRKQLIMTGTWNSSYDGTNPSDWTDVVEALAAKQIDGKSLITHRFNQERLMDGLELMKQHQEPYCKVMTLWNE